MSGFILCAGSNYYILFQKKSQLSEEGRVWAPLLLTVIEKAKDEAIFAIGSKDIIREPMTAVHPFVSDANIHVLAVCGSCKVLVLRLQP